MDQSKIIHDSDLGGICEIKFCREKAHPKSVWKRISSLYVWKREEKSIDLYSGIKCKSHFTFSQASAWLDIWCKIDISSQVKSIQLRFSAEKYDWEILLRITLEKWNFIFLQKLKFWNFISLVKSIRLKYSLEILLRNSVEDYNLISDAKKEFWNFFSQVKSIHRQCQRGGCQRKPGQQNNKFEWFNE